MPDVVIVGGGLSGLSAAWELHRQQIPYTLIEVKNRLGGSILTERRAGFTLDGGRMASPRAWDWSFLAELGLTDALINHADDQVIFRDGAGALIDALAKQGAAQHPTMLRMAVHSIGMIQDGVFGVCLENGVLLSARAVIIAAPARYAEPMFRQLQPEIAYRLFDFRYDTLTRVSLGYRSADAPQIPSAPPPDYPIIAMHSTDAPARVPDDSRLVQVAVRHEWLPEEHRDLVGEIAALFGWADHPQADLIHYWSEADALFLPTEHGTHAQNMTAIRHLLPEGVGLAGSDYAITDDPARVSLAERVSMGREAALRVSAYLRA